MRLSRNDEESSFELERYGFVPLIEEEADDEEVTPSSLCERYGFTTRFLAAALFISRTAFSRRCWAASSAALVKFLLLPSIISSGALARPPARLRGAATGNNDEFRAGAPMPAASAFFFA